MNLAAGPLINRQLAQDLAETPLGFGEDPLRAAIENQNQDRADDDPTQGIDQVGIDPVLRQQSRAFQEADRDQDRPEHGAPIVSPAADDQGREDHEGLGYVPHAGLHGADELDEQGAAHGGDRPANHHRGYSQAKHILAAGGGGVFVLAD